MMHLTPKAQTLKALFPTKKPTYETRSKRKLETAASTSIVARAQEILTSEAKKGKLDSTDNVSSPSAVSTPKKLSVSTRQTNLQDFFASKQSSVVPTPQTTDELSPKIVKVPNPPLLVQSNPRILTGPKTQTPTLSVPAYLRYASLSCSGPLALPEHLSSLEKNFKYMFHTMLYQKVMWNTFTFHQLQPAIEKTSKRNFPISQLGQFKQLFPDLFEFESTRIIQNFKPVDSVFIKVPSLGLGCQLKENQELDVYPTERIELLCKELHKKLVAHVHIYHNEFLLSRSLSTYTNPPSKWHPAFEFSSVPHIASQPLFPVVESEAPQATLAERAKLLLSRNTSNAKPMSVLERARAQLNKQATPTAPSPPKSVDERKADLQRRKEELLDRIKAKEKERIDFEAANPNIAGAMEMRLKLSQLQAIVRAIKAIFVSSHGSQPTKTLDSVVNHISTKNVWKLSLTEISDRLELLAKVVPSYISVDYRPISKNTFITLKNPALSLSSIEAEIEAYKSSRGL